MHETLGWLDVIARHGVAIKIVAAFGALASQAGTFSKGQRLSRCSRPQGGRRRGRAAPDADRTPERASQSAQRLRSRSGRDGSTESSFAA